MKTVTVSRCWEIEITSAPVCFATRSAVRWRVPVSFDAIVRASQRDLETVEGVGPARAREIREGLRRLQEHNLVDRYLQL